MSAGPNPGSAPLSLLFITSFFPPLRASESDYAWHLARHLAGEGARVHVLTTKGTTGVAIPGVQQHPVMRDWSWADLPRLTHRLRTIRPDAILLTYLGWLYNHHPMITFLPSFAKRLVPQARVLTLFHNAYGASSNHASLPSRALRRALRAWVRDEDSGYEFGSLLSQSDRVIVHNRLHGRRLIAYHPPVKRRIRWLSGFPPLHLSQETERESARQRLGFSTQNFVFAFFGFLYGSKGVETLFHAFASVHTSFPQARLMLAGGEIDGRGQSDPSLSQRLVDLARDLRIEGALHWMGGYASDSREGSACLRAADVAVFPFDLGVGPQNSSFASAAAHGLPLIATRGELTVGHPEVFRDGENVFFCAPKSPPSLAAAMKTLLSDPGLRDKLGRGARAMAERCFCGKKLSRQILSLCRDP